MFEAQCGETSESFALGDKSGPKGARWARKALKLSRSNQRARAIDYARMAARAHVAWQDWCKTFTQYMEQPELQK